MYNNIKDINDLNDISSDLSNLNLCVLNEDIINTIQTKPLKSILKKKIEFQTLNLKNIDYPNLRLIETIADGSCFFHSILKATNVNYFNDNHKSNYALNFRKSLAEKLTDESNTKDKSDKSIYQTLSRGSLPELSQNLPEFSLEQMQFQLSNHISVDNRFNELVSNELNIDIYILDSETGDLYITGDDADILYFDRPSVVLYYSPGHYRLVGVYEESDGMSDITDFFHYTHSFIVYLKNRMNILLNSRIK